MDVVIMTNFVLQFKGSWAVKLKNALEEKENFVTGG
jgi:hypothetical protein